MMRRMRSFLFAQGGIEDFWVTSQGIIYLVEGDLYGAPVDGGDEEGLMSGVWDYVVADGSLVVLGEDGALLRCGLDGTEAAIVEEARDRYDESLLLAEGDDVYLVSDKLLVLRAGEDALEDVGLEREIRDTVDVVIYDGGVLYEASNEKPYRHVLTPMQRGMRRWTTACSEASPTEGCVTASTTTPFSEMRFG